MITARSPGLPLYRESTFSGTPMTDQGPLYSYSSSRSSQRSKDVQSTERKLPGIDELLSGASLVLQAPRTLSPSPASSTAPHDDRLCSTTYTPAVTYGQSVPPLPPLSTGVRALPSSLTTIPSSHALYSLSSPRELPRLPISSTISAGQGFAYGPVVSPAPLQSHSNDFSSGAPSLKPSSAAGSEYRSLSSSATTVGTPIRKLVREETIPGQGPCWVYEDGTFVRKIIDGEPVNASWGITKAGKPRKRLAMACKTCRDKKIKCEPAEPKCAQCERSGRECRYETARNPRRQ